MNGELSHHQAWRQNLRREGATPATLRCWGQIVLGFRRWLGDRPLTSASTDDIENWLDTRQIGAAGRSTYLKALNSFFTYAQKVRWVRTNPVAPIRRPKVPRGVPHPIPEADLTYALTQAKARMRAWLCLAAYQGFRCTEIAALRVDDLLVHRESPLVVVSGKGGKRRVLPLNPLAEEALRSYGLPSQGYVFRKPDGTPLKAATVSATIARFLHDLGLASTAHDGRHYFATQVYQRTHDIRLTQELLGHSHPATTAIYAAFDPAGAEVVRQLGIPGAMGDTSSQEQLSGGGKNGQDHRGG